MWHFSANLFWTLFIWQFLVAKTQDTDVEVTITRGTTGLGIHLVSETRGKGAVVERVVPKSAASLVLLAGDVLTSIAGVEVTHWSLDNINRLLGVHRDRVKLQLRRPAPEPRLVLPSHEKNGGGGGDFFNNNAAVAGEEQQQMKTASCYASVDGDTDNLHAFACAPATFGADISAALPGSYHVFPVAVAQPLEHCARDSLLNATGFALLVSRGGCLPGVKARNAARNGAEAVILVEGQFPPFPPLPSATAVSTGNGGSGNRKKNHLLAQQQALLATSLSSQTTAYNQVDIPVLTIGNGTGQRIISEVRDHGREVVILSHAGSPPSRLAPTPRKQIPLDESESLHVSDDAFNLKSAFRDGHIAIDFGEPGLPRGKTPTMFLQVPCELSTLLTGEDDKRISFDRTVRCPVCGGRGAPAADMRPCKHCSSSAEGEKGISTAGHHHSREVEQTLRTTCSRCHGFGELPKKGKTCPRCKGERTLTERTPLEISIPRGAPDLHTIRFPGIGSHLLGRTAGDVEISLKIEPHATFTREGPNLRAELPISLTEALSGLTREILLLNGTLVPLNKTGITKHNDEIEIFGGGLPVWDPATTAGAASARKKTKNSTGSSGRSSSSASTGASDAPSAAAEGLGNNNKNMLMMDDDDEEYGDHGFSAFGSAILTCTVVFPENLVGGRLIKQQDYVGDGAGEEEEDEEEEEAGGDVDEDEDEDR